MRISNRQTDFTLDEILDLLETNDEYYPSTMLLNEVGLIHSLEKDKESEKILICYLSDTNPDHRIISFCNIYCDKEMLGKYHSLLVDFRLKPENHDLLEEIDESIAHNELMRSFSSYS